MKHIVDWREWSNALLSLFFPRCCTVCGIPLTKGEECICTLCNIRLPRTDFHLRKENPVEQLFWGKLPLERATSFFFYHKGSDFRQILHQLKYEGQKEVGETMGRYMATELLPAGFFESVDVLIPVPLHKSKQKLRGYNQSEWIARGVSGVTGIPIDTTSIIRKKNTETQTRKSVFGRWENVEGTFQLTNPDCLTGKHLLLIDDVLTTGSTIVACASALSATGNTRISVLTLAAVE